ncbi:MULTISPECIES: F0F1 ATP synthase subunit epsilon [Clostridium]|uniref:ATP synthase epsilon chain n=2 Tax=Clostridium TaxID=1485 RepID=A0A151AP23_9CLOT|nr:MULTISPECIES: F0F1 ATP synthase subunit epsilon [Clostridium]KYH29376.1 ATP synthase epsilon chain [Clostridium colicanis DSM 13634]MBE6044088.1 F0F1 ATP synthase subunit epsilon [Clostridium thermopalmarium]PRR70842.1 ATP synthase epsilon chain [Clostridium thermopalmarium DSM 5974]PVZ28766.1 F-type H+-transporting ATPase subunit epsilon [Clostridium thermopalmarium DSM 5974]
MLKLFKLKIVTPVKIFFEGQVKELDTETLGGKRGILPMHSPLIAMLKPTVSKVILENGEEKKFFSSTGILKVSDGEVLMLCDAAEWPEDIDRKRAEEAKARAEGRLKDRDNVDIERARMALLRAIKRLEVSNI